MPKHLVLLVACATIVFSSFDLPLAVADCGKMVIHIYNWPRPPRRPPRPFYGHQLTRVDNNIDINNNVYGSQSSDNTFYGQDPG